MSRQRFAYAPLPHDWVTLPVDVPNDRIQTICVLMEAYDNLCVVRTPEPGRNRVHLYVYEPQLDDVRRILADIAADMPMQVLDPIHGMPGAIGHWET